MKKFFFCLLLFALTFSAKAQEICVEKSIFGVQTGFLGIWGHHEARLSNSIVLRTELGFDSGIWGGDFYEKTGFLLTPVIIAEPRWYYNLKKRENKFKRIDGNSGNFIALKTRSEEHTSELQSRGHLVCRLLLEKKNIKREI